LAGTVASGYVTALGFAIYVMGEIAYYRILGPNSTGDWRTETIARKSGTIRQGIENDYDEQRFDLTRFQGKNLWTTPGVLRRHWKVAT